MVSVRVLVRFRLTNAGHKDDLAIVKDAPKEARFWYILSFEAARRFLLRIQTSIGIAKTHAGRIENAGR